MGHTDRSRGATIAAALALMLAAALASAGCSALNTATSSTGRGGAVTAGSAGAPSVAPDSFSGPGGAPAPADTAQQPPTKGGPPQVTPARLVVVNKTLRLETADVKAALDKIRALAKKDGGDIANMQVSTSSDQPIYRPVATDQTGQASSAAGGPLQAYVTVRVPAATYTAFVDDAAKLGTVLFQSESTDDVTQQHVDMKARLDNLKSEEARLRQLFAKARTVKEMLEVETELARVQGEVESLQAQISYLENQAALATVTIELAEPKPIVRPAGIDWGVGSAVTESVRAFVGTLNVLIVVLGPVLAILIFVGLPVLLVVRWIVVRTRRRSAVHADPTSDQRPDETVGA